ncbi:MAG: hypothetical protein GTN78_19760 [Gemmatimonadales bacterium]|nr:hypothetical protein [Gemmatimonadales bacterium]NIN12610.1 hypothetical protein [Gemmatimonadales bacterium]NIR02403.1 hypothetical protein [Gemmatimonadales bacterium]NIS66194.1 hypothetical protein [Gemmatimonadales bacterium]
MSAGSQLDVVERIVGGLISAALGLLAGFLLHLWLGGSLRPFLLIGAALGFVAGAWAGEAAIRWLRRSVDRLG